MRSLTATIATAPFDRNGRALNGSKLPFVECLRAYATPADFAQHVYDDLQVKPPDVNRQM